jgi:2-polyprenyl-3-methyl-5-hydroxy-6-metoxy-1,4-benzoquinol methylase
VLDVGTGTGVVALACADRGFDVTAIDHSTEMLKLADSKARARQVDVSFELADAAQLPYEDESFVGITCQGALHHMPDLDPVLSEIRRLLAPGGYLYISEPCGRRSPVRACFDVVVGGLLAARRMMLRRQPRNVASPTEAPLSADELIRRLHSLGFETSVRYMTHFPFLYRFLPDRVRLWLVRILSFPWQRRRGDMVFIAAALSETPDS